jgi:two-component system, LytTR family, response regulator
VTSSGRLRALIVDDERLARRRLAAMLLEDHPTLLQIDEADGGSSAVEKIVRDRPDVVFLDVQMPGLDGFGVLRCSARAHRPVIVFVTAHDKHAIRAFEVHAADYLLKPVSPARLQQAVQRAVERVRSSARSDHEAVDQVLAAAPATPAQGARIPVREASGITFLKVSEITWIEADGDHVHVHAGAVRHTVRDTMRALESTLAPFRFLRVHRSAIVNPEAVRSVHPIAKGDYHLVLHDGTRVRSGRRYREAVQALMR